MFRLRLDPGSVRKFTERITRENDEIFERVLHQVGADTVKQLQGYTSERTAPAAPVSSEDAGRIRERAKEAYAGALESPDEQQRKQARENVERQVRRRLATLRAMRRKRANRPVHPGGWADRTQKLRDSYSYELRRRPKGWQLIILNSAGHASLLEQKLGFFVVRGVGGRGGIVQKALRRAVAQHAPDWKVTDG